MIKSVSILVAFFLLTACSSNVPEVSTEKAGASSAASSAVDTSSSTSSVMAKPDPKYDFMNKDSAPANNNQYCADLSRKIEELKGKPQRRYAAQQRYDLECKL